MPGSNAEIMKVSLDTLPEPGSPEAQPASARQVASAASNLATIGFSSSNVAMRLTCSDAERSAANPRPERAASPRRCLILRAAGFSGLLGAGRGTTGYIGNTPNREHG